MLVQRQLQAIGVDIELGAVARQIGSSLGSSRRFRRGSVGRHAAGRTWFAPYLVLAFTADRSTGATTATTGRCRARSIRHAADDDAYRAGVAAFQRAIVDDPPGDFPAWRERARAVSRRFDVPVEPGSDVLTTLHLWRPTPTTGVTAETEHFAWRSRIRHIATRFALLLAHRRGGAAARLRLRLPAVAPARHPRFDHPGNQNVATRAAEEIRRYVTTNAELLKALAADLQETGLQPWQQDRILKNYVLQFREFREITLFDESGQLARVEPRRPAAASRFRRTRR